MATILTQLDHLLRKAISDALGLDADPQLSVSQNEQFGDYQSNAAMGLVKPLLEKTGKKLNPRAIAEQIKAKLNLTEIATEVTVAGPGFVNIRLDPQWLAGQLQAMGPDTRLGLEPVHRPVTVVVDYSGPNIAKEMHVGHLRSTIIGDAIARILGFQGHTVIRQNHIGDWGTQFGMLIAELRSTGFQGHQIEDLERFYRQAKQHFDQDPKFAETARQTVTQLQAGDPEILKLWKTIVDQTRIHYQPIYAQLGVLLTQQDERGESAYNAMLPQVVEELKQKQIAVVSDGAIVVQVPGYESPLIIQKSDGGYLYGTTDLAAIRYRISTLHAQRIIYTHDSRQQQHFAQVFWTAEKAGWATKESLDYAPFGTLLGEDGKPFKTRSGDTVKLKDLLDEAEQRAQAVVLEKNPTLPEQDRHKIAHSIGIGAVKYSDLARDRTSDYHFSFDKMLALDGNTAPYLQYAHARVRSIFRKAGESQAGKIALESPYEIALAKHILRLGEVIDLIARDLKPHNLCTYLYELATKFSGFYENCPVLQSSAEIRASRLALCDLAARTMALGLDLLGIDHPDQM